MLSMRQMRKTNVNGQAKLALLLVTLFYGVFTHKCYGTPLNNVYDTQPIYSVFGADKFFKKRDCGEVRFIISPFYQQTSTVRDNKGDKVPAGDRLGKWNMFGLFFGPEGAPLDFSVPGSNYPDLRAAQNSVALITSQVITPPITTAALAQANRYRVGPAHLPTVEDPITVYPGGLTNELNFDPDKRPFAYVSVPLDYEKIGVRSQVNFDFKFGLGFSVKGGVVDVKQAPSNFIFERQFQLDAGLSTPNTTLTPPEAVSGVPAPTDAMGLYCSFMDPFVRTEIVEELNIDLTTYRKTEAEDVHIQVYWHFPINFRDRSGDLALTMIPYLAAGLWLPTGDEIDQNKAFAVPTGNDGFTCFTADASLAFDFPILPAKGQTLQGAFGGGILLAFEKGKVDQRFPTSELQNGIIPWKIGFLTNRPGLTWYLNLSAKSEEFIEGLSIYFDFLYTKHLTDKISLKNLTATNMHAFAEGLETFVPKTSWKNQQVNVAFNYRLADQVSLGGAVQAHISGIRVYRSVTILGGVTVTF